MSTLLDEFDYELPPDLIAQAPAAKREDARLLVLHGATGSVEHVTFAAIGSYLRAGDLLVVNDTRVILARLRARKSTGGAVEVFLLSAVEEEAGAWRALIRPARAARREARLALEERPDAAVHIIAASEDAFVVEIHAFGKRLEHAQVLSLLEEVGENPLPPYIHRPRHARRDPVDRERYQTVYARQPGAVAAPTAGLHFSREALARLVEAGVEIASVTLHVGRGTFQPPSEQAIASGCLHGEEVEVTTAAGEAVLRARSEGRRIIAVGTTTVRALESFAAAGARLPYHERTTLFIRPPHRFQLVDALVTNFHLPRSSLLVLVSAFAGRQRVLDVYRQAVAHGYRFYSFGDAMLIH